MLPPQAPLLPGVGVDTFIPAKGSAANLLAPKRQHSSADALHSLLTDAAEKRSRPIEVINKMRVLFPQPISVILNRDIKDFRHPIQKGVSVRLATALKSSLPEVERIIFVWRCFRFGPVLLTDQEYKGTTRWLRGHLVQKLRSQKTPAEVEHLLRNAPPEILKTFHNVVGGTSRGGTRVNHHSLAISVYGRSTAPTRDAARNWEELWRGIAVRLNWTIKDMVYADFAAQRDQIQTVGGGQGFDLRKVETIYRSIRRVYRDGDENGVRYYFPEELERADEELKIYLGACGWEEEKIDADFMNIKGRVLAGLWTSETHPLGKMVPSHFQRSDSVQVQDPIAGEPIDLTKFAARLWKDCRKASESFIRVVALKNRMKEDRVEKKFYFINREVLLAEWQLLRYPTFDGLKKILKNNAIFERCLHLKVGEDIPENFILVGRKWGDANHCGLRHVTADASKKLGPPYFQLHFTKKGKRLLKIQGMGGLELGLAWLEGAGYKAESSVEKCLAATLWGIKPQAEDGDHSLHFTHLKLFLRQGRWIKRLVNLHQFLTGSPTPSEEFFLEGIRDNKNSVAGFRFVPSIEGMPVRACYFQLHFSEGGKRLLGARGAGGMELAFAWLEGSGLTLKGPVEKSLVAGLLGGQLQAKKGERSLSFEDLEKYLSVPGSAERLAYFYQHLSGGKTPPEGFTLTGRRGSDRYVSSLLLFPDGVEITAACNGFKLHFSNAGKGLESARGTGGAALQAMWLKGN